MTANRSRSLPTLRHRNDSLINGIRRPAGLPVTSVATLIYTSVWTIFRNTA